jgi:hypothetical protein
MKDVPNVAMAWFVTAVPSASGSIASRASSLAAGAKLTMAVESNSLVIKWKDGAEPLLVPMSNVVCIKPAKQAAKG